MESFDPTHRYQHISERVKQAALQSGRDPAEISIVVVSKGQPASKLAPLIKLGVRDFGENYPEETEKKIPQLSNASEIRWHMIGHLQSRKAAIVARYFSYYHSLDRMEITAKLQCLLAAEERVLPAMLEVNISGEETKGGFSAFDPSTWPVLAKQVEDLGQYSRISLVGLMCMPPLAVNPYDNRPYFESLRLLRDYLRKECGLSQLNCLSMGTSEDFEAAILEGATHIRVGQAILGPRPAKEA